MTWYGASEAGAEEVKGGKGQWAQLRDQLARMDPAKLNTMKVPELKSALQERGLSTVGLKAELVERLNA